MDINDLRQRFDLTESEILGMRWASPRDYVLELNYYWALDSNDSRTPAVKDQLVSLTLQQCIRLEVDFSAVAAPSASSAKFGTIVGWGEKEPSPWKAELNDHDANWLHVFLQVGATGLIEALCQAITFTIATTGEEQTL